MNGKATWLFDRTDRVWHAKREVVSDGQPGGLRQVHYHCTTPATPITATERASIPRLQPWCLACAFALEASAAAPVSAP